MICSPWLEELLDGLIMREKKKKDEKDASGTVLSVLNELSQIMRTVVL